MALPSSGAPDCSSGLSARIFNNLRYDNPWKASQTGVTVGTLCCPTTPAGIGFRCSAITTGVTGGSEPTWPSILTNTVVDGGVTWTAQDVANPSGKAHTPTGQFAYVLTANDLDGFRLLAYDLAKGVCDELAADNEAWTAVTFSGTFANFGSGFATAAYRRNALNEVFVKGLVTSGTAGGTIFPLPPGYRPLENQPFAQDQFNGVATNSLAVVTVNSNGNVVATVYTPAGGGNLTIACSFLAEQ